MVIALSCDACSFAKQFPLHHRELAQTIWPHLSFVAMPKEWLGTPLDPQKEP